jgi:hypothetical protein
MSGYAWKAETDDALDGATDHEGSDNCKDRRSLNHFVLLFILHSSPHPITFRI